MKETTIQDYYERMYKLFPNIPKKDIRTILRDGWRLLYLHNSFGADTLIRDKDFWCYIGYMQSDSVKWFEYYIKKLCTKIRFSFRRKRTKWDGNYYFSISKEMYEKYKNNKEKEFDFGYVLMFKIFDECNLRNYTHRCIFKIPYEDNGYTFEIQDLVTDKAELILEREPLTFKDVMTSNNKYSVI